MNIVAKRAERAAEVGPSRLARFADDLAYVTQQARAHLFRLGNVFARALRRYVRRNFQLQSEGGEVVTQDVVQLA